MPDTPGASARIREMLREAFARQGATTPDLQRLEGDRVPEPFRSLLVHDSDMTSTLQRFHGFRPGLRCLHVRERDGILEREVLLCREGDGTSPVEYGVIRIRLASLAEPVRESIREGRVPLGGILDESGVPHRCRVEEYFRLAAASFLDRLLEDGRREWRYGRLNRLRTGSGALIAEVIEILPGVDRGG